MLGRPTMQRVRGAYSLVLAKLRLLCQKLVSFAQGLSRRVQSVPSTLRQWYLDYVHSPNNPVDQAAQRLAHKTYTGIQRIGRGSVLAGHRTLAFVLSVVAALGLMLLIGTLAAWFIEGTWTSRLLVVAVFVVSTTALLGWFASASTVGVTIRRFRYAIVTEFLAFGVLGVLVAAQHIYSLFD